VKHLQWIISAAVSAFACHFAVYHTTPIDRALPVLALVIVFVAWAFDAPAALVAVPALILAEIGVADETVRLVVFGMIVSAGLLGCWVAGLLKAKPATQEPSNPATALVIAALIVLRWIPTPEHVVRELALIALAVAIAWILGRTPFAIAVAVITALVTPAVPLRTFALPLAVLLVAILARTFGMPRLRLALPSFVVFGFALLFFAWSGVVARAFPYFLKRAHPLGEKYTVNYALPPSRSVTLYVPDGALALIVSGANVPRLRRGALLGRIEPNNIDIRIGDAADWGYMRRDAFYGSHNPLPRDPAGKVRGYGYLAWVDGAGRVPLPRGARTIRVTADAHLPANASLQIEGFEIQRNAAVPAAGPAASRAAARGETPPVQPAGTPAFREQR
jgi:hypothetical protein